MGGGVFLSLFFPAAAGGRPDHDSNSAPATCSTKCTRRLLAPARIPSASSPTTSSSISSPFCRGDDALQTCVLDTQWRDLWRRKTSLRIIFDDWLSSSRERFYQLVKLVIHLRGESPLTDCQINPCLDVGSGSNFTQTELLIEYVLECGVEKLSVSAGDFHDEWLSLRRLVSPHLRILEFDQVHFEGSSLDFSDCPAVEKLTMEDCSIYGNISSKSLKHLRLIGNCFFLQDVRIHIDAPCLISISLLLDENYSDGGLAPSLGMMPLLKRACVRLGYSYHDSCESNREDFSDPSCDCCDNRCLLLDGLSNAVALELIAEPKMFIYRWDLKWCSKFDKLKTVVLNDWFTAIDLVCILKHSPILEKLTLKLDSFQGFVGATVSKQSLECVPCLAVSIECRKDDKRVCKILHVLSACGLLSKQISIKRN